MQRIAAWLTCATMAIACVGVPLPARSDKKAGGEPFPCQHCPCGCRDAETCWRDCCCYTNQQKLAWARRNGVAPPAYVVAAARREQRVEAKPCLVCCVKSTNLQAKDSAKAIRPGCERRGHDCAKCAARCSAGISGCCEEPAANMKCTPQRHSSSHTVLLISKLRCQGISLSVTGLPPSLPAPASAFGLAMPQRFELCFSPSSLYQPPCLTVAAPPPDRAHV